MFGFDWFLWAPLIAAGVGALVKVIWPSKAKQVDTLMPIFQQAWGTVEAIRKGAPGPVKLDEYLDEVKKGLQVRGIKPKQWHKSAAEHFARTMSATAKLNAPGAPRG